MRAGILLLFRRYAVSDDAARSGLALALVLLTGACAAHPPTKTTNPLTVQGGRTDIVSVCFSAGDHGRAEVEAAALAECPKGTASVTAWKVDRLLNDCPLMKKSRASFLCVPAAGTR